MVYFQKRQCFRLRFLPKINSWVYETLLSFRSLLVSVSFIARQFALKLKQQINNSTNSTSARTGSSVRWDKRKVVLLFFVNDISYLVRATLNQFDSGVALTTGTNRILLENRKSAQAQTIDIDMIGQTLEKDASVRTKNNNSERVQQHCRIFRPPNQLNSSNSKVIFSIGAPVKSIFSVLVEIDWY